MFTALAENHGNLRSKINLFVAMAPVVRLDNTTNEILVNLGQNVNRAQYWMASLGFDEVLGPEWFTIAATYCPLFESKQYKDMCYGEKYLYLKKRMRWDSTIVPMEDQKKMNAASAKQIIHFG